MRSEHAFVGGASDAGKTTLMREGHDRFDGVSIWCNHTAGIGEGFTSDVSGYRASGRKAMHTACEKYDSWDSVRINLKVQNIHQCVSLAVRFAIDLWDTVGAPCQIIVDECQHLFGKEGDDAGTWILTEGRDKGIKGVFATQNPQAISGVPKTELLNVRYWCWIGEYPQANRGWLDYYGFDTDRLPEERFKYVVFDRSMNVMYEGKTQSRYA